MKDSACYTLVLCFLAIASIALGQQPTATVATEGAMATMQPKSSQPAKPNGQAPGQIAGQPAIVGGPLDAARDLRSLLSKGNALIDKGNAIADRVVAEGKLTVDVRIPQPAQATSPAYSSNCPNGLCPLQRRSGTSCPGGICPPPPQASQAPPLPCPSGDDQLQAPAQGQQYYYQSRPRLLRRRR